MIQRCLRASDIKYIATHAKGRQDDIVGLANLDRMAQLNAEMDYWANECWGERYDSRTYFNYDTPNIMWKITMLGTRVCNHLTSYLQNYIELWKGGRVLNLQTETVH